MFYINASETKPSVCQCRICRNWQNSKNY